MIIILFPFCCLPQQTKPYYKLLYHLLASITRKKKHWSWNSLASGTCKAVNELWFVFSCLYHQTSSVHQKVVNLFLE